MNAFEDIYKQAKEAEQKWEAIDEKVEFLRSTLAGDFVPQTQDLLTKICEVVILLTEEQRPNNVGLVAEDLEASLKGLQDIMGAFEKK